MDFSVLSRTLSDLAEPTFQGLKDPYRVLSMTPEKRRAFLHNPYADDLNAHCQTVGVCGNVAFGGDMCFPLLWRVKGSLYPVRAGSTTFVADDYRKTGFGLSILDYRDKHFKAFVSCGAGASQMMLPLLQKYFRNTVFLFPRFVMLVKSRAVVEMFFPRRLVFVVSPIIDICLWIYRLFLRVFTTIKTMGFQFREIELNDSEDIDSVSAIIASDSHPYSEFHDRRWLEWHMKESFTKDGPLALTLIKRGDLPVAFYMTKKRFHEQASHRGFKNVWLGSIVEWGAMPEYESVMPWLLLESALSFKGVDAIEVSSSDRCICRLLRCFGWQHVGNANANFRLYKDCPFYNDPDIKNVDNWRIRPAMSDMGLA